MNLHIANCTKQHFEFVWRLRGSRVMKRDIPAGGQIVLNDMKQGDVDQIVKQHERYGMLSAIEANKRPGFTGRVYSVGAPVRMAVIEEKMDTNEQAAADRSTEQRTATTAATAETLNATAERVGGKVGDVDVEITEVRRPGDTNRTKPFEQTLTTGKGDKKKRR